MNEKLKYDGYEKRAYLPPISAKTISDLTVQKPLGIGSPLLWRPKYAEMKIPHPIRLYLSFAETPQK
jgi:hypothetical protein